MKSYVFSAYCFILLFAGVILLPQPVSAGPPETIESSERCAVCGMFVAKYPNWVTQIQFDDGTSKYFDGVKDLMAYLFDPSSYGSTPGLQAKEHGFWQVIL